MENIPFERQLWNAEQCAEYCQRSIGYFRQKIQFKQDFPKPVTDSNEQPLWRAIDVSNWRLGIRETA